MKTLIDLYKHVHWANQRILEALQNQEVQYEEIIRLFSHILLTEKMWLARIQGVDTSKLPIWSDVDIKVCENLVKENKESLTRFLDSLETEDLEKIISYSNSKGIEFKNTIREILTHLALHGQYHRGQINARLRATLSEPMNVDFITFVR